MDFEGAGYSRAEATGWDLEITDYQKKVFNSFSRNDSYNIYVGDDVWSPEWRQRIQTWHRSRSKPDQHTLTRFEIKEMCENRVARCQRRPENLEFADLFLAYPIQAYALWNLMEKFVQLDAIITRTELAVPQKPLEYLQRESYRWSSLDLPSIVPIFEFVRQYELVTLAVDFWNRTRPRKAKSSRVHITWIFDVVDRAFNQRSKSLKRSPRKRPIQDEQMET